MSGDPETALVPTPPSDDEAVYIKGRKMGELEYAALAQFFCEKSIDRGLWNIVLQEVAQSEDTGVRRMLLGLVLDETPQHAFYRDQDEIYYRARKLIHATKRRTGRSRGLWSDIVAVALFFRHFVVSKEFIMFLLVICIIIASCAYLWYSRGSRSSLLFGGRGWR